jgi:hypothetical protein
MSFNNISSLMNLIFEVEYLSKADIFKIEEKFLTKKIDEEKKFRRPRFFSEVVPGVKLIPAFEVFNFGEASVSICDNYFTKK